MEQINPFKLTGQNIQLETHHQFLSSDIKSLENKINNFWQASRIIPPVSRVPASTVWHEFLVSDGEVYWSSSFLLVAKAGGPDNIPNKILKGFAPELALSFTTFLITQ